MRSVCMLESLLKFARAMQDKIPIPASCPNLPHQTQTIGLGLALAVAWA